MKTDVFHSLVDASAAVDYFVASVKRFEDAITSRSGAAIMAAARDVCESSQVAHILASPSPQSGLHMCRSFCHWAKIFCTLADAPSLSISSNDRLTLTTYISNVKTRIESVDEKRAMQTGRKRFLGKVFSAASLKKASISLTHHASRKRAVSKTK